MKTLACRDMKSRSVLGSMGWILVVDAWKGVGMDSGEGNEMETFGYAGMWQE